MIFVIGCVNNIIYLYLIDDIHYYLVDISFLIRYSDIPYLRYGFHICFFVIVLCDIRYLLVDIRYYLGDICYLLC